ncbi:hypothetical protein SEPCBS57363_005203 [Sporothrix epigloea]|uniref:Uncharacterized protein n=1 Tax=Sporothrix epigloea TaxID=1892477 RepID=A0ABP0E054_9PEZI
MPTNESAVMRPDQSSTAHDMTGNGSDLDDDTSMDDIDDSRATYDSDMDGSSEASEASEAMSDACDEDHSDEYSVNGDDYEDQQSDSASSILEACSPAATPNVLETHSGQGITSVLPSDDSKEATQPFSRLGLIVCPSIGHVWLNLPLHWLLLILKDSKFRGKRTAVRDLTDTDVLLSPEARCLAQRFSIIRAFTNGVGVVDTDRTMLPFFIKGVMSPPALPSTTTTLWDMMPGFHRCSMLHMIPEIKLIIVGNMFGRVVLIRALRNSRPQTEPVSPLMALRVEWSLPFTRDEQAKHRPPCCLLGIAVSPLPEPGSGRYGLTSTKKHRLPERPRRYRLILHYMDHTILQYYIEGSESGGDRVDVGPI